MAKLVYSDGGSDQEFALDPGRAAYTVGRNPMCDLRINDPSISRKHAEVRLDAASGAYSVYDLNSSNGTYVNGERHQQHELTDGDEIMCGEFKILFSTGDGPARPPSSSGGRPPPPRPPAHRHSKTLAAKPGDLTSGSAGANDLQQLTSPNSEATMKVSSELLEEAMPNQEPPPATEPDPRPEPMPSTDGDRELKRVREELADAGGGDDSAKIAELESTLEARDAHLAEMGSADGAEAEKLKAALAERDKEVERLQKDLAKMNALEGELEVARSRIKELQSPSDRSSVDELQQDISAMKEAFKDFSSELKELVAANRELAKELAELKG